LRRAEHFNYSTFTGICPTKEHFDARRGTFEVRDRGRLIVVSVAFNAPPSVADRFIRLRDGDFVRIEGRFSSQDRFDLEIFQ
jgi:hypothetical protein